LLTDQVILVTGGAGFIGSNLITRLLREGRRVVCLDSFNDYYDPAIKRDNVAPHLKEKRYSLIEGDIRDEALVARLFAEHRPEIVVHLAARAGVRGSLKEPALYVDVNERGTAVLLEAARQHKANQFIFGSSSSVYGADSPLPFSTEDTALHPISPYAATKRAGELLCYTFHHLYGLNVLCARFFTVYGPHGRPDMAIYKFTKAMFEGRPISVYGDGTSRRDYTHVDDIVDGLVRSMGREFGYEIINLGRSDTVMLNDLIAIIEREVGGEAKIERLPEQPGDVPATYADIEKSRCLIGFDPKVDIREGVRRFVAWYREAFGLAASSRSQTRSPKAE